MAGRINLTGQRFGRLVARTYTPSNHGRCAKYTCDCDCGNQTEVRPGDLRNGHTTSCGCVWKEYIASNKRTHGMFYTPEREAWSSMRQRCSNPNRKQYKNYGGRGIKVCDRWNESFEAFYEDMGPRPTPKHSIDRIDNDGDYTPENCRWADRTTQNRNRRSTAKIEWQGERLSVSEWADRLGMRQGTLYRRVFQLNWTIEKAMTTPVKGARQ